MSALSTIKAVLEADATLLATATGGVWDWDEAGRQGISRTSAPTAFDALGILKPCILLRLRTSTPDGVLRDDEGQYTSVREMIEAYLFQDTGYDKIETMKLRMYQDLHAKRLIGMFRCEWAGDFQPPRDLNFDASVLRCDYLCIVKRSVS